MQRMSMARGYRWVHKQIELVGFSLAGISTSIAFPDADVCFDVAQGLPFQVPIKTICLSHGHQDHAAGLPYLLGQKAMMSQKIPEVYMPGPMVEPMREILRLWGQIEDHALPYQLVAVTPDLEIPLKKPYLARPFRTFHRIPSTGYTVFERKKQLRPKFHGLSPRDLADLRRAGEVLDEHVEIPRVSFTGDTRIEFFDEPHVRESQVLVMECTYWDNKKSVATAREWGHIHLDEIIPRLDDFAGEKIVLIHASARYSVEELQKILRERVPERHRDRVELFPRSGP